MAVTTTMTETVRADARPASQPPSIELEAVPTSGSNCVGDPPAREVASQEQPAPVVKLVGSGFSFFCAGVNDGTLGALVPYILSTFAISTGKIAIIYVCTFAGWFLAAVTNPVLTVHLTLGQLLVLGAGLQLLAQCLRPWSPLPLFFASFFVQALGMAYQDAHANTFVSGVRVAHRWLGFIHACYALGLLVGPPIATAIAVATSAGDSADGGWRKVYYVLVGLELVNLLAIAVGFRDSLRRAGPEAVQGPEQQERKTTRMAMQELLELMKVRSVWVISLFYFFELGAGFTIGGWVVEFLTTVRHGQLSQVGYVPTGYYAGLLLGRMVLPEPTFRFGERRMLLVYSIICACLQLVFWLAPSIIANATALGFIGFFFGPFFATGVSVASKIFPRKIQAPALSFVFVVAQAGGAIFPSLTGLIAARAGVQVLQPIALSLIVAGAICWWMVPKVPSPRSD